MLRKAPELPVAVRVARLMADGSRWTAAQLSSGLGISAASVNQVLPKMLARGNVRVAGLDEHSNSKRGPAGRLFELGPIPVKEHRQKVRLPAEQPEASDGLFEVIDAMVRRCRA